MTTRRVFMKTALGATVGAGIAGALPYRAFAADWPKRPVKIICPFAAGGNTDGIGRLIAQHLSSKLGESFIVENRVGAGGAIGTSMVAKSAPDGYTLMIAALPQLAIVPNLEKVDYDPAKDFTAISNVALNPFCLSVHPSFGAKTLAELIAYVKERPGKISYASGGTGSLGHLTMVMFTQRAGLDMVHVPYKGGAPAMSDVLGNHVPMYFGNLSEALPHAGKGLRSLAVSGASRAKKLPDVPTVAESGFPGFRSETWNGLIGPAGIPQPIVDLIANEVRSAMKDPVILERLESYGTDPIGSTPAEFKATIDSDIAQWAPVVKAANLKP